MCFEAYVSSPGFDCSFVCRFGCSLAWVLAAIWGAVLPFCARAGPVCRRHRRCRRAALDCFIRRRHGAPAHRGRPLRRAGAAAAAAVCPASAAAGGGRRWGGAQCCCCCPGSCPVARDGSRVRAQMPGAGSATQRRRHRGAAAGGWQGAAAGTAGAGACWCKEQQLELLVLWTSPTPNQG